METAYEVSHIKIVELPPYIKAHDVYNVLNKYGAIERVRGPDHQPIFTVIKTPAVAQLVRQTRISVDRSQLLIQHLGDTIKERFYTGDSAATPIHRELAVVPVTNDQHMLNILNDDCLYEIFNASNLDVFDLLALSRACKRFRVIALEALYRNFADDLTTNSFGVFYRSGCLWRIEDYLYNLGHTLRTVKVDAGSPTGQIELGLTSDYCHRISDLNIVMSVAECHDWRLFNRLFDTNPRIKTLRIDGKYDIPFFNYPSRKFHHMKTLHLYNVCIANSHAMDTFFKLNEQIENVCIRVPAVSKRTAISPFRFLNKLRCLKISRTTAEALPEYLRLFMPNKPLPLEHLIFDSLFVPRDKKEILKHIGRFKQLKRLDLTMDWCSTVSFKYFVDQLDRMKQLEELHVTWGAVSFKSILDLLTRMTNLKIITLATRMANVDWVSNYETMDDIRTILEQRSDLQFRLYYAVGTFSSFCPITAEAYEMCKSWLSVGEYYA